MVKHFIDLDTLSEKDLLLIFEIARLIKNKEIYPDCLTDKNIAMIFEKSSTRTRVSFEVGLNQLNANTIIMNANDMQLSKGEEVGDTAAVLSRYVDGIIIRANSHQTIKEFARYSRVPVINALSDFSHPCQIIASILTIIEKLGTIKHKKLIWFGEPNNVLNSYIHVAAILDYELVISSPSIMDFSDKQIDIAIKKGAKITKISNPLIAAHNGDVLITDTWFSMGDNSYQDINLRQEKIKLLMPYQVNKEKLEIAKKGALFTHCLPAYRGYEVAQDVIDSSHSIIFDEAENRLHGQKAILAWLYGYSLNKDPLCAN